MKRDFKDKKNSEVKKTLNTFINYDCSGGGQSSLLGQTSSQSVKKNYHLY